MTHKVEDSVSSRPDEVTPMTEESRLLPCPFCAATMHIDYDAETGMFGPEGDHGRGCMIGSIDFRDYADANLAAEQWNTRALATVKGDRG